MSRSRFTTVGLALSLSGLGLAMTLLACSEGDAPSRPVAATESALAQPSQAPVDRAPLAAPPDPTAVASAEGQLRSVLADPDPYSRARRLGELLPTLGPEAAVAIMDLVRDTSIDLGGLETELIAHFWAGHDPEMASRWAVNAPLGYRAAAVVPVVYEWAQSDPEAAMRVIPAAGYGSSAAGAAAEIALVRGWFVSGRPGLLEYIHDLEMGPERQRALAAYSRELIRRDGAEAAMAWAEAIPAEDRRYKIAAHRQLGSELAQMDLDGAREWCRRQCDGDFGVAVRKLIAMRWAGMDGPATMEWLSTAPPGQSRDSAVREAFQQWAGYDRSAAFAWLTQHEIDAVPEWKLPAVVMYAKLSSMDSPAEALRWAERIPRDREREITMVRVARRWRSFDQAAADAWIDQSPLSPESREDARNPDQTAIPRAALPRPPQGGGEEGAGS